MMVYCFCKMRICERCNNFKYIMISIDICVVFGRIFIVSILESSIFILIMRSRFVGFERSLRFLGLGNFLRKRNILFWFVSLDYKG